MDGKIDQYACGLPPTHITLLCPWKRHCMVLFFAWQSWQAVLNFITLKTKLAKKIELDRIFFVCGKAGLESHSSVLGG